MAEKINKTVVPSKYSLVEYQQIRKIETGIIAGFTLWGDTKDKTLKNWDETFEKFKKRKIKPNKVRK